MFSVLLAADVKTLDLELPDADGHSVLWLALTVPPAGAGVGGGGGAEGEEGAEFPEDSYASRLIARGSSPNAANSETGQWDQLITREVSR